MDTQAVTVAFRVFLPSYFVAFILILGPISAYSFRKKYGFDPTSLKEPNAEMEFGEAFRNGMLIVILALTIVHAVWPPIHTYLGPIRVLEHPSLRIIGVTTMALSVVLIRVAQLQLKSSWRFGVDRAHPPDELITTGLFSVSRNPIFLGLMLTAVGLLLALPNAVTFAFPNLAYVLLQTRARVEERFMAETFGADYEAYRSRTPRWLIGPKG